MTLKKAAEIVMDLAEQNILNPDACDSDLESEASKQREALESVTQFFEEYFSNFPEDT